MRDKKGLSAVITTLIIILLVLVAIGIVWVVVRGVIETGTGSIDVDAECLKLDIKATATSCSATNCTVTLTRGAGGKDIEGVKLVFKNTTSTSTVNGVVGNIAELGTITTSLINTGLDATNKVEVTPYFKDSAGNELLCKTRTEYNY